MGLNAKQQRFVQEYLVDGNATQAAIRSGYSARSAAEQGHDLLRNPKVAAAVAEATEARSRRTGITADRVLNALVRIADKAEALGDLSAAIRAQELLGKHMRLFVDRVEHSAVHGLADLLQRARARVRSGT